MAVPGTARQAARRTPKDKLGDGDNTSQTNSRSSRIVYSTVAVNCTLVATN